MWRKEPVLIALAGLDAVVVAVLTALMSVGVLDIDGSQLAAISAAVLAVTTFVGAILRGNVVSPETHQLEVIDALYSPIPEASSNDLGSLENMYGDDL